MMRNKIDNLKSKSLILLILIWIIKLMKGKPGHLMKRLREWMVAKLPSGRKARRIKVKVSILNRNTEMQSPKLIQPTACFHS